MAENNTSANTQSVPLTPQHTRTHYLHNMHHHSLFAKKSTISWNSEMGTHLVVIPCTHATKYSTKLSSTHPKFSRTCCRQGPKSSHINVALRSIHWLKIKQRIDYKITFLTYKVLTTTQPSYLYNLISVQPHRSTRSSNVVAVSPTFLFLAEGQQPFFPSRIYSVSRISFSKNIACLLIMKTYHSYLISHKSVRHFLHHHCHHSLFLLSSTPGSKLIFSTKSFPP